MFTEEDGTTINRILNKKNAKIYFNFVTFK